MLVTNHNLTEFWSPLKILSAFRVGVKVKVEFTGNACFHHVLFTLLMYFMASGAYGYSGKAHIGAIIIELFIKDVVKTPSISFNNEKNTWVWIVLLTCGNSLKQICSLYRPVLLLVNYADYARQSKKCAPPHHEIIMCDLKVNCRPFSIYNLRNFLYISRNIDEKITK